MTSGYERREVIDLGAIAAEVEDEGDGDDGDQDGRDQEEEGGVGGQDIEQGVGWVSLHGLWKGEANITQRIREKSGIGGRDSEQRIGRVGLHDLRKGGQMSFKGFRTSIPQAVRRQQYCLAACQISKRLE